MPPDSSYTSDSDRDTATVLNEFTLAKRRNSHEPKYVCKICSANFKRLDNLDRHEFHHTGIKKHVCTYEGCEKAYSILTHLKRHLRTTHERTTPPEKNVACLVDECDKLFPSLTNMQRHMREVHENPKVYNCSFCNEKFTQKLKMRRHEISKHTKEYPFNCNKCSKGFYQEWQYEKHTTSCKVYHCTDCETKFDKWSNYIKHCKEFQHGRKYYKCEHCPRIYAKPGELQRHIMTQHVDADLALQFKCTVEDCGRAYAYERNLRQHMKTAHSGKRFECEHEGCQRDFTSAQNLAKHIKRDHSKRKKATSSCSEDDLETNQTKELKPARKKRKDAGKAKISNLATVTGIAVDRQLDKLLQSREGEVINAVAAELIATAPQAESSSEIESNQEVTTKQSSDELDLENLIAIVLQD